jgi:hypothetical protein
MANRSCLQRVLQRIIPGLTFEGYESRPGFLSFPPGLHPLDRPPILLHASRGHIDTRPFDGSTLTNSHALLIDHALSCFHEGPRISEIDREKYTIAEVVRLPRREALANVAPVPSEYLLSAAPEIGNINVSIAEDRSVPRQLTDFAPELTFRPSGRHPNRRTDAYLCINQRTTFVANMPANIRAFADEWTQSNPMVLMAAVASINVPAGQAPPTRMIPTVNVRELYLGLHPKDPANISLRFNKLAALYTSDFSKAARESVDSIGAPYRMVGANIPRTTPNYEGVRQQAFMMAHALMSYAKPGQRYLRLAFRLLSLYFEVMTHDFAIRNSLLDGPPDLFNHDAAHMPPLTQHQLVYLGTDMYQVKGNINWVAPAPNVTALPEQALYELNSRAVADLSSGRAVFIDATSMSHATIRTIVKCFMVKNANDRILSYRPNPMGQVGEWCYGVNYADYRSRVLTRFISIGVIVQQPKSFLGVIWRATPLLLILMFQSHGGHLILTCILGALFHHPLRSSKLLCIW